MNDMQDLPEPKSNYVVDCPACKQQRDFTSNAAAKHFEKGALQLAARAVARACKLKAADIQYAIQELHSFEEEVVVRTRKRLLRDLIKKLEALHKLLK